ncbi:MAG TPA: hypothetical protein DD390_12060 [Rhodospirillaceae bacterium]|nr:hypothetical protein [Rhodospirillaceae bacterium]MAX61931.1 hypothetical protein [Rhodospirillaceae bacterium]MAX63267.1 hypothetical protein [Rhodospirillaceae bacterium]HBM13421.1 hypothetical protein [Rhodospirillaceae bacterium]|tara:strand:- start:1925 stop:2791 length:867 start_codon:yes stop_codon:yes gene_type:complete
MTMQQTCHSNDQNDAMNPSDRVNLTALHKSAREFTHSLGFTCFSYLNHEWPSGPIGPPPSFCDLPLAWIEDYESLNGLAMDPVHARGRALTAPDTAFSWSIKDIKDDLTQSGDANSPLYRLVDAADRHQLVGGVLVSLRGPLSAYTTFSLILMGSDKAMFPHQALDKHRAEIIDFAYSLHIELTSPLGDLLQVRLTARQVEALEWRARGKANDEIAELMGLSIQAVKAHLQKAFVALGAANGANAVALALSAGLIRLFPQTGTFVFDANGPDPMVFVPPKKMKRRKSD